MQTIKSKDENWDFLTDEIVKKIKERKPPKLNTEHFKKWLMKRKKIGYLFDRRMIFHLYNIHTKMKKDFDHVMVFSGYERLGKSTFASQVCAFFDPTFDLSRYVFNPIKYKDIIKSLKKLQANQYDEAVLGFMSSDSTKKVSKIAHKTLMVMGKQNTFNALCIPNFHYLSTYLKQHRVSTLVQIKARGLYRCYVTQEIIGHIADAGKVKKDILGVRVPQGYFWDGYFRKDFPPTVSKKAYEDKKENDVDEYFELEEGISKDTDIQQWMKATTLADGMSCHVRTIKNKIQQDKIKGKKMLSQWYVLKKDALRVLEEGFS
jgi:hypothetical protein